MHTESLITDLAFILLLGAAVTVLFKWIRQPVVLGYIVAGFLASPHFQYLPSVTTPENIDFWAEIGIVILLFSLGLEFSFKKLLNSGGSAVVTALIIVTGMMCAGMAIGHVLHFNSINSLFLGGMLSMSSTTIIIKAFTDMGLRQKKFASLVLAVLIVEDLFAVVMMVILSSIAINNSVQGTEMLYSVAKLVFFLLIWFITGVYVLPSLLNLWRPFLNSETLLVVSMGLCLGMAVFSVYCGFSLALGAFVMGSILAGTSYAERIEHVVTPVKDLFGAVFFISVGMMVQPAILVQYWGPILLLSAVVIVGMIVFGTAGMLVTGQSLRVAIQSGFSLTQIGEFAFIIATLGMSLKVLDDTIYPIVVAVSVITTFSTPYFIKMSLPFYGWVERHLPRRFHRLLSGYHRDSTRSSKKWPPALKKTLWRTVIYSVVLLALQLVAYRYALPLLKEWLGDTAGFVYALGTLAVMSPFLVALLLPVRDNDAAPCPAVPRIILSVIRLVLVFAFIMQPIATVYPHHVWLGAAIALLLVGILFLSGRVRNRMRRIENRFIDNLNERENRRSGKNNAVVNDLHQAYMTVGTACPYLGQRLIDSDIRTRYGVNIVSIQRGTRYIPIPGADNRLYPGDVIGVIGNDEQLGRLLPDIEADLPEDTPPAQVSLVPVLITPDSPLVNQTARSAAIRNRYDSVVIALDRGEQHIDTDPDLVFRPGDILWLVGNKTKIDTLN